MLYENKLDFKAGPDQLLAKSTQNVFLRVETRTESPSFYRFHHDCKMGRDGLYVEECFCANTVHLHFEKCWKI